MVIFTTMNSKSNLKVNAPMKKSPEEELTYPIHCICFKTILIEFLCKVIISTTAKLITTALLNNHLYHS